MVKLAASARHNPVAGRSVGADGVHVTVAPPASRLALRAGDEGVASFEASLPFALPREVGDTAVAKKLSALCLGPDEWLLINEAASATSAIAQRDDLAFSATDVSHRNVAFIVSGPHAADCLNAGCPRDLSLDAFPVGRAARTVIGKTEVVIHRTKADAFRVECWRSFAVYLMAFLKDAARDAAL